MKGGRHDRVEVRPDRPSLESLRKQAKKLGRDIAAGDACRHRTRARTRKLPNVKAPLTQRNAQLLIAREYGYAARFSTST